MDKKLSDDLSKKNKRIIELERQVTKLMILARANHSEKFILEFLGHEK